MHIHVVKEPLTGWKVIANTQISLIIIRVQITGSTFRSSVLSVELSFTMHIHMSHKCIP